MQAKESLDLLRLRQALQDCCNSVNFWELTLLLPRGEVHGPYQNLCFLVTLSSSLAFSNWSVCSSLKRSAVAIRKRGTSDILSAIIIFLSMTGQYQMQFLILRIMKEQKSVVCMVRRSWESIFICYRFYFLSSMPHGQGQTTFCYQTVITQVLQISEQCTPEAGY